MTRKILITSNNSLLYQDNKVLPIRKIGRPKDKLYFPIGGAKSDELHKQKFLREMKEELEEWPKSICRHPQEEETVSG